MKLVCLNYHEGNLRNRTASPEQKHWGLFISGRVEWDQLKSQVGGETLALFNGIYLQYKGFKCWIVILKFFCGSTMILL